MIKIKDTFKSYKEYKDFYQNSAGYDLNIDKITDDDNAGKPIIHRWQWGLSKLKELGCEDILDVGSWTGRFPVILKNNGFKVRALEPNKAAYKYMKKHTVVPVKNRMFEEYYGKHEAITAFEVIEHVYDMDKFLKQAHITARYLLFSTPNKDGIYGDDDNELHLWTATFDSIEKTLDGKNFDIIDFDIGDLILICAKRRWK